MSAHSLEKQLTGSIFSIIPVYIKGHLATVLAPSRNELKRKNMTSSAMFLQPASNSLSDMKLWHEPQHIPLQFALPYWRLPHLWLGNCSQYFLQNSHLVLRNNSEKEGAISWSSREKGNLSISLTAHMQKGDFPGKFPQYKQGHKFKYSCPFLPTNTF